jgi:TonB family protein
VIVHRARWLCAFACLSFATSYSVHAWGQSNPGREGGATAVQPPALVKFVQAVYPPGAEVEGREAAVLLSLTIDEAGTVTEAKSLSNAGHGFDEAAEQAARKFVFSPAKRDGVAVPVRIQFRTVFELREVVVDEPVSEPVPSAPRPAARAPNPTSTEPPPASDDELMEFGATAEVEAPARETTRHSLRRESMTKIPGTRGDPLRAVEVLPGVSGVNNGNLVLRGAAHNESQVYLDGMPIPLLYHFGELTSVVQGRLLDRVDYYPGNFSVRYGRVSGGVVEARLRDPRTDRLHGAVDLNLIDSSVLVEGPLSASSQGAFAVRRSNIDLVFEHFVPEDAYSVTAAPVYYDFQAMTTHQVGEQRIRLLGYGSRDALKLFISDPLEEDPALRGEIEGVLSFRRLHVSMEGPLGADVEQRVHLAYDRQHLVQKVGTLDTELHTDEVHARGEWQVGLSPLVVLLAGLDVETQFAHGRYYGPPPPQNEGTPEYDGPMATLRNVDVDGTFTLLAPAGYVELSIRPAPSLLLVPGVRFDYFGQLHQATVDPRLAVRYAVTPVTTVKWGVGLFTQRPEFFRALEEVGNPELAPYRALHGSVGIEHEVATGVRVEAEGFYKSLTDRVVAVPGGRAPRFVNDGVGRVYGLELSSVYAPDARTFGYFAYTLSRSERRDRNEAWRLFDQDRTHVLSLALHRDLGAGWEVGGRFRLASGTPETPVAGSVLDLNSGQYMPEYGPTNSSRTPVQHRLDVRVEKQWRVGPGLFAAYVDVINVYNAQQREGTRYAYDYRKSQAIEGMPIFPNLGLRGEL